MVKVLQKERQSVKFWQPDIPGRISWGRQACFRIYEYQDGRIGYPTQYLE
jgi:uncharacterized protein (DUF1015 family)